VAGFGICVQPVGDARLIGALAAEVEQAALWALMAEIASFGASGALDGHTRRANADRRFGVNRRCEHKPTFGEGGDWLCQSGFAACHASPVREKVFHCAAWLSPGGPQAFAAPGQWLGGCWRICVSGATSAGI
jgi:hypothetical protein